MPERHFEVLERGALDKPTSIAARYRDGERIVRVGDTLRERGNRHRTVQVTWIELWMERDWRGETTGTVWMAGVIRNTSRRTQAISVERLTSAYEPRMGGWPTPAETQGDQHGDDD